MAEDNVGEEDGVKKMEWQDIVGYLVRALFLALVAVAFVCSLASQSKCNFLTYEPSQPPTGVADTRPDLLLNISTVSIGLYKYEPNDEGCREITEDFDQLSGEFTAARVGASFAAIFGAVCLGLLLIDLLCCRFICFRLLITLLLILAVFGQALTFLAFAAPICDPNYKNGPYPCSSDDATWFSIFACVLYAVSTCFSCCLPRPLPVMMRVKESMQEDENDSCFAVFAKKPPPEENEQEGDVEEAGATEEKDVEEAGAIEEKEPSEEEPLQQEQLLQNQQAEAAVAVALATVRRSKQEEIEKQLELLTTYKDHISEEEYDEKVAKLLQALPDPDTYDAYTKTDALIVIPAEEKEVDMEEVFDISGAAEQGEGEGVEVEEQKKSFGNVMSPTISSGVTSVKKTVGMGGSSSKTTPAQADTGNSAIE